MIGPEVAPEAVRRLAQLLHERIGLRPSNEGSSGVRLALQARLQALGEIDANAYVRRLERGSQDELRSLLPLVTVGKTDFFRDTNQFRALRTRVFPEMYARACREGRKLRVWSAGCATGEEPYSLAMLAGEMGVKPDGFELLATDINPSAIERASAGHFPARRLETVPRELLARYFDVRADNYEAKPELKAYVRFAPHNLASNDFPSPSDNGLWDIVLCRNVLIYFDGPTTARVVGFFSRGLIPGGYLCLGYSESLFRISNEFDLVEIDGSFLYRKPPRPHARAPARTPEELESAMRAAVEEARKHGAVVRPPATARPAPVAPAAPAGPAPFAPSRLAAPAPLAPRAEPAREPPPPPPPPQSGPALSEVHDADPIKDVADLVDRGEFDLALKVLRDSLECAPGNLALQITLGNVCTVMGRRDEALAAYRNALAGEPLCAEAHLFLGVACFEMGHGREGEAEQEMTRALFLDPHLALAHYYSGRIAERKGDVAAARRAYRNAVDAARDGKQRGPLLGYFPDLPADAGVLARAAQYALSAIDDGT